MAWLTTFYEGYSVALFNIAIALLLGYSVYITLRIGILAVGQAAFMGIGAYTAGLLSVKADAPLGVGIAAAMLLSGLVAWLVGRLVLRLSGVFLAISTVALVEMLRALLVQWPYAGGAVGLIGIPAKTQGWHLVLAVGIVAYFFFRLQRASLGAAIDVIAQDEDLAAAMGINVAQVKSFAFIVSAITAALAGALSAHYTHFILPADFGYPAVVRTLSIGIIGGFTSAWGPLLGGALVASLPELLSMTGAVRTIAVAAATILVILFLPGGLVGLLSAAERRRGRERREPTRRDG